MALPLRNKKARFHYELVSTYVAGMVLHGYEVKALKTNKGGSLAGSFIKQKGIHEELYLQGAFIPPYQKANTPASYDPRRERKLLLSKRELEEVKRHLNTKGLTAIPLALHNAGNRLVLEFAIARGKKQHDKRQAIKDRQDKRKINRLLKNKM